MDIEGLIKYIRENVTEFVAIITVLVSSLSQLLALVEYLRLKGRWDYYYIDETARKRRKNGFHPEYLISSLFIIGILFFVFVNGALNSILKNNYYSGIFLFSISCLIFWGAFAVHYVFSRSTVKKGIYTKSEYRIFVVEKAIFTTVKYSVQMYILFGGYRALINGEYSITIAMTIVGGGAFVITEYMIAKVRCARNRVFDVIKYKGKHYCVFGVLDLQKYYITKAVIENDSIDICCETNRLIDAEGVEVRKMVFKKVTRSFNGSRINSRYMG